MTFSRQRESVLPAITAMAGAIGGVAVRFLTTWAWPSWESQLVTTSLIAAAASFATGVALSAPAHSLGTVFTLSMSGAAFSISVIAVFVLSLTPAITVACLLGAPVCGFTGLAVGMLFGLKLRRGADPTTGRRSSWRS